MSIDWFQIIAQIINFFIILFILQKLLYKPVLKAMSNRQERIEKAQIEADKKMDTANEMISNYETKIANIEKEKREIIRGSREEAQEIKESLLDDYKKEADDKRKAYLKEIEDEKEFFIKNLRNHMGQGAVKIASHIIGALSSEDLEQQIFSTFVQNLKELRSNIKDLDSLAGKTIEVYSFNDLSQNEKTKLEKVLKDQIKSVGDVQFFKDSSLVLGYQLNLETYTIQTNIKNYLNEIEKDIIKNLNIS